MSTLLWKLEMENMRMDKTKKVEAEEQFTVETGDGKHVQ
jgi:hypothetical protein